MSDRSASNSRFTRATLNIFLVAALRSPDQRITFNTCHGPITRSPPLTLVMLSESEGSAATEEESKHLCISPPSHCCFPITRFPDDPIWARFAPSCYPPPSLPVPDWRSFQASCPKVSQIGVGFNDQVQPAKPSNTPPPPTGCGNIFPTPVSDPRSSAFIRGRLCSSLLFR